MSFRQLLPTKSHPVNLTEQIFHQFFFRRVVAQTLRNLTLKPLSIKLAEFCTSTYEPLHPKGQPVSCLWWRHPDVTRFFRKQHYLFWTTHVSLSLVSFPVCLHFRHAYTNISESAGFLHGTYGLSSAAARFGSATGKDPISCTCF